MDKNKWWIGYLLKYKDISMLEYKFLDSCFRNRIFLLVVKYNGNVGRIMLVCFDCYFK